MWPFAKKKLSEPVQTIVNGIDNDEWILKEYVQGSLTYEISHSKLDLNLKVHFFLQSVKCSASWMTVYESKEVADAVIRAYNRKKHFNNVSERERFMKLVDNSIKPSEPWPRK